MKDSSWLERVDAFAQKAIAARLEDVAMVTGEVLFSQCDSGDGMYMVKDGVLDVYFRDPNGQEWHIDQHGPGGLIGEMALLTGRKRSATIVARERATLKRLSKSDFDALCATHSSLLPTFSSALASRLQTTQLIGVLAELFGVLEYKTVRKLQQQLAWKHFPAGTVIDYQSEPQGSMYIVINGRLQVDSGTVSELGQPGRQIGRGDTYGDFNLLTGRNSPIRLIALRDTDVVRASQDVVESLLKNNPQSVLRFVQRTSLRLREPPTKQSRSVVSNTTIAICPLGSNQPVAELAKQITAQLERYGTALHLNSGQFDLRFGKEGAAQTDSGNASNIAVNHWLTEIEHDHAFVIYETDNHWSPWTRRCLRQADRIILASEAGRDPGMSEIEEMLARQEHGVEQELVLIHPENATLPAGTAAWLANRTVAKFHHVRLKHEDDLGRLARSLIDREVGLVLSGGGARGFAHVGVFKALQEAGIPVDIVGGTSMGALIGGALCQDTTYDEILGYAADYGSPRALYDFTLPVISFLASKKLTRLLQTVFLQQRIEDMWRPFFCVSANLSKATPIIHRDGLAWQAVRGSLALPGIFAPYSYQGDVVVDGGVMNNLPIDLMRKRIPGGWIIGVNVSPPRELDEDFRFESGISGWRAIADRINPFGRRIKAPNIFATLTRAVEVRGIYQMAQVQDKADWIIHPDVATFNYLDFRPAAEIAEAGYLATVAIIDQLMAQFKSAGYQLSAP